MSHHTPTKTIKSIFSCTVGTCSVDLDSEIAAMGGTAAVDTTADLSHPPSPFVMSHSAVDRMTNFSSVCGTEETSGILRQTSSTVGVAYGYTDEGDSDGDGDDELAISLAAATVVFPPAPVPVNRSSPQSPGLSPPKKMRRNSSASDFGRPNAFRRPSEVAGNRSPNAGIGNRSPKVGSGKRSPKAGSGKRSPNAGSGKWMPNAGSENRSLNADSKNQTTNAGSENQSASAGSENRSASVSAGHRATALRGVRASPAPMRRDNSVHIELWRAAEDGGGGLALPFDRPADPPPRRRHGERSSPDGAGIGSASLFDDSDGSDSAEHAGGEERRIHRRRRPRISSRKSSDGAVLGFTYHGGDGNGVANGTNETGKVWATGGLVNSVDKFGSFLIN
eukprot:CAMPEP_0194327118 /NCGR_PEP_ID=MMETSP0171-20130528/39703_1 /TAXON_ID=218684 /ORGANISM="Corethron pennatum, Strain L29A3" /LENGTH=391 /DNA_ID=CAMNT_0039086957 /DNA_START=336 /DNA_END=1508 /DNA_ORIENTATION=+